jgi:hypothetical protein
MNNLQLLTINGETILTISLFGPQRREQVDWNKKIMVNYFNIPVNYIECPFPGVSHGWCMNQIILNTIDSIKPDYYLWIDSDMIFLKKQALNFVYNNISNKITVFGQAWMNNHQPKPRGVVHSYASQACLAYSTELYNKLGRPNCDHGGRSDTSEEITYEAKEKGYCVSLLYPNNVIDPNTPLDASCFLGFGNFYGQNMMFHCSQFPNPKHEELFIDTCKKVLNGDFEK